jgi:hypothetical protein
MAAPQGAQAANAGGSAPAAKKAQTVPPSDPSSVASS